MLTLTAEMEEGIARLDVRQEGISKALAFTGTLDQTSDVDHVEKCGHFAEKRTDTIAFTSMFTKALTSSFTSSFTSTFTLAA